MLDPGDRLVYLDALRPPEGYSLDSAIGTTYTLDLTALLVIPLSMALFPHDEESPLRDPVLVLEALQRNAERVSVYCQRGGIKVPSIEHRLYTLIERMVVEVAPPDDADGRAIFHPKTWLLRFTQDDGPARYRFLCASRNLTFDRAWDTLFVIEGDVDTAADPFERNRPLADFIRALPGLAVRPPDTAHDESARHMLEELPHVDFRLPDGSPFDHQHWRFHPMGIVGHREWPFPASADRVLVVSPFLSSGVLAEIADDVAWACLVSRPAELARLGPRALEPFAEVRVLADTIEDEAAQAPGVDSRVVEGEFDGLGSDGVGGDGLGSDGVGGDRLGSDGLGEVGDTGDVTDAASGQDAGGLHAKIFVMETGDQARVFVGSTNATAALPLRSGGAAGARGRNVEFLVELLGSKRDVGIDAILDGTKARDGLRGLTVEWDQRSEPSREEELRRELERALDELRRAIAASGPVLVAEPEPGAGGMYSLVLRADGEFPASVFDRVAARARCWPISRRAVHALPLDPASLRRGIRFPNLSVVDLTRFMAFELGREVDDVSITLRFVLSLPLEGAPADRGSHVLRAIIADSTHFMRYLLFLLAEGDGGAGLTDEALRILRGGGADGAGGAGADGWPLLEELVRTVSRSPEKIARIGRLVEELRAADDGTERVPPAFDRIWAPIERAWRAGSER